MQTRKILAVIDDSLPILEATGRLLASIGYDVELYASAKGFLDAAKVSEAVGLIVDIQLGEACGIELARQLADAGCNLPIIFMTASISESVRRRAIAAGCVALLIKPFTAETLIEALAKMNPQGLS